MVNALSVRVHVFWSKIGTFLIDPLVSIYGPLQDLIEHAVVLTTILWLPAVGFLVRRRLLLEFSLVRYPIKVAKFWFLTIIAFTAVFALTYFASVTAGDLFGKPTHFIQNYDGEFDAAIILFTILAATNEELVCRMVLRDWAGLWTNSRIVVVLFSGLLFGVSHIDQGATVATSSIVFGMALMAVYMLTRSIYAPIVIHIANNLLAFWADTENARRVAGLE